MCVDKLYRKFYIQVVLPIYFIQVLDFSFCEVFFVVVLFWYIDMICVDRCSGVQASVCCWPGGTGTLHFEDNFTNPLSHVNQRMSPVTFL